MFPIKDTVPNRTFPVVIWSIIAPSGIVFYFETKLPDKSLEHLIKMLGIVPAEFTRPYYRTHHRPIIDYLAFITTMFLHGGWLHVLGNMWFLYVFGSKVEDVMGHYRFAAFYIISGIFASMMYIYISPRSPMPVIGASGAIAGVMGAYYGEGGIPADWIKGIAHRDLITGFAERLAGYVPDKRYCPQ